MGESEAPPVGNRLQMSEPQYQTINESSKHKRMHERLMFLTVSRWKENQVMHRRLRTS